MASINLCHFILTNTGSDCGIKLASYRKVTLLSKKQHTPSDAAQRL